LITNILTGSSNLRIRSAGAPICISARNAILKKPSLISSLVNSLRSDARRLLMSGFSACAGRLPAPASAMVTTATVIIAVLPTMRATSSRAEPHPAPADGTNQWVGLRKIIWLSSRGHDPVGQRHGKPLENLKTRASFIPSAAGGAPSGAQNIGFCWPGAVSAAASLSAAA
jgi:hypothetical protein